MTRSFKPVRKARRALVFRIRGIEASEITGARARLRAAHKRMHRRLKRRFAGRSKARRSAHRRVHRRLKRQLNVRRVRNAARTGVRLRLRKPAFVRGGRLRVNVEETPTQETTLRAPGETAPPNASDLCTLELGQGLEAPGCVIEAEDTAAVADSRELWGLVDCGIWPDLDPSRAELIPSGGDFRRRADGSPQGNDAYRRLTVRNGDDVYGQRCEVGRNEHRYGEDGGSGTFYLYREGERRVTALSLRLPESFQLETNRWQTVIQMKQTQPASAGGGAPILEIQAYDGRWRLVNSWTELWSTPAQKGVWSRIALDVHYSQDPSAGFVRMHVDSNGDGSVDANSPTFKAQTLKTETAPGNGGLNPGDPIPSSLRTGIYHDPSYDCPGSQSCSIDIDNVQVLRAP